MKKGDVVRAKGGQRCMVVLSNPRRIDGSHLGCVDVTWKDSDGELDHPAHRPGFVWSEPVCNLESYK
jgi:hypothetical protein